MGFFDRFFKKEKVEVFEGPKNKIIRAKCPCGHKKAKNKDGFLICRRCKAVIGGA